MLGDLRVSEPVELRQQEGLANPGRQAIEQGIDFQQGFQQQVTRLGAWQQVFGEIRQAFQVRPLQRLAAQVVDHQAFGDGGQIGPRLADIGKIPAGENAQEGVMGQVGRIECAAQALLQAQAQPAVVLAVELMRSDGAVVQAGQGRHARNIQRNKARFI